MCAGEETTSLIQIHRSRYFVLQRQAIDGQAAVRKTVCDGPPASRAAELLSAERAVLSKLAVPGVARPLAWEGPAETPTLVLEDAGPEDLAHRLGASPLPIDAFFDIAIQLADICALIHREGVVHRAIAPSNVVLGRGGKVTLVDFIHAAALTSVAGALELEPGELSWISPEQTGRMSRLVDWRSDLYSLGATCYAMLTGAPPFRSPDVLELVHGHLARIPVPASVANRRVPPVLSDIVQKLLAKMPERRYQSAEALAADLREARRQWDASGVIQPFELGQVDLARQFPLPEKLYGRERELAVLQDALARVSTGGTELVLLAGEAGIGKTALVEATRDAVAAQGGWFISGKFDLRATNMPYASVVEALRSLARALAAEPEERRAHTFGRIREAVPSNGRLLTELVPELREVLGDLPEVPAFGPVEAENRLHMTLQAFIRAIAADDRPLVLFLDDLQWADAASLRALRALATDPASGRVLLLGAFRPREVGPGHALLRTLDEIGRMGGVVEHLALGPLGIEAMVALLGDVLRCAPERARPLAGVFLARTAGNPFFVRQLLRSLQHGGLFAFDEARGTWTWDLRRLERTGITENVAELMTAAIRSLPPEAQQLLQVAACVGKRVSLRLLVAVGGEPLDETTARLGEPLREGLLVPEDEPGNDTEVGFRFVHDRVQQAAYALLSDERRSMLHLQIGRQLELSGEHGGRLFDIADQLNLGAGLVAGAERIELAWLDHRAGVQARRSAAYGSALAYFRAGLALLSEDPWQSHHELSFVLHRDAAECASLTGDHARCRAILTEGLRHVTSTVEAADLHALRIASATVTAEYESALAWGREALATFFGSRWPEAGGGEQITAEREAIGGLLGGRSPEALVDQPLMTSPEDRSYLKLVAMMLAPAWFADRKLLRLLTASSVRFTLERGACCESILPYGVYATLVVGMGETREAVGWSRLAMGLARRFDDHVQETRALQLYNNFVRAWVEPLSACAAGARRVFEMGLQWGEFQQAAYGRAMMVIYPFVAGIELDRILAELHEGLVFCRQIGCESQVSNQLAYRQAIRCLKGLTLSPAHYDDDEFDESTFLSATQRDPSVACLYHILRLQTSYLFHDLAEARAQAEAASRHVELLGGYIPFADHTFYSALLLLSPPDGTEPRARLALVLPLRRRLEAWEEGCPESFRHKRLLLDAEVARVEERILDAGRLYDRAIEAASKAGFVQDAALANELSGRFYRALDLRRVGDVYLRAAVEGWARWGALGKARALDEEFALGGGLAVPGLAAEGQAPAALQALSLLKAAETISSEIVLDRLLGKLMEVCIQAASAVLGVLVFEEEDGPFVRAIGRAAEWVSTERTPLARSTQIPREVIEHVRRTRRVLVLDDASLDPRFASDPYIAEGRSKSILVLPIQRKDALLGTFFLANDLTTHAFTTERVGVLELLSAEIAIALENSLLFEKLKVEIEERRRAESAVRFLADASAQLSESLDYPTTLRSLSRLVVPTLANWCVIDVVAEDGKLRRIAGAHGDPAKECLLAELSSRYPPEWDSAHPASQVLASGAPLLFPAVTEDVLTATCRDAEHARLLRDMGTASALSVPLVARGKTLGALTLGAASSRRPYGPSDVALAAELAHRAAMAIDNARLYHEAQEGIRVREEFLCIASHELRTPITAMRLGCQGLLRRRERPLDEPLTRVLQTMERQTRRLMHLVDDLLEVSRIHAGQLHVHAELVDLSAVAREIAEQSRQRIQQSGSRVDIHAGSPVVGMWDKGRMEQVISNLLDNALKFGSCKPITLTVAESNGMARLTVEDRGIGIPPERLPRVFDRFERAVSAQNYGGFGLGLYIVRRIMEAHGGAVRVDSTPGAGTTFTVELPCQGPRASPPPAEPAR